MKILNIPLIISSVLDFNMDNALLSLAYLHSAGFTHKDLKILFERERNYQDVLDELSREKRETPWISQERRTKIQEKLRHGNIDILRKTIEDKAIVIVPMHDARYPERLRTIKQSPYFLYVRGNLHEEHIMLGVVGSRRNTHYGKKVLETLIPPILGVGWGIISGGAHGIDTLSHEIALANNGYTISVFGCGVDIYYPSHNRHLFDTIIEKWGALISIFPIGTKPEPYYFPIRNEVVAALSNGIIIPEAGLKSWTLITAWLALEHGRDVFAVPGDIFRETSAGTNMLIATWQAKCIQNAADILEEYFPNLNQLSTENTPEKTFENEEQKKIYHAILEWYDTPDSIWKNTSLSVELIIINLSLLEMEWYIHLSPGGKYEIT